MSETSPQIRFVPLDEIDGLDLREALLNAQRDFWDDRDLRAQHHPVWFRQFSSSAVVAIEGNEFVGYLLGAVPTEGVAYVHLVATRTTVRNRGIGTQLYKHFFEYARAQGATRVQATTVPDNAGSVSFHTAIGFQAELVSDYAGPGDDRVLFDISLVTLDA